MTYKIPAWFHLLDEFARHPDQIALYDVPKLRIEPGDQLAGLAWLLRRGLVAPAGYRSRELFEELYAITPKGREFWEQNVKGRRNRPKTASPIPKWSTAQLVAATGPRDAWSLSLVPWTWSFAAEKAAEAAREMRERLKQE